MHGWQRAAVSAVLSNLMTDRLSAAWLTAGGLQKECCSITSFENDIRPSVQQLGLVPWLWVARSYSLDTILVGSTVMAICVDVIQQRLFEAGDVLQHRTSWLLLHAACAFFAAPALLGAGAEHDMDPSFDDLYILMLQSMMRMMMFSDCESWIPMVHGVCNTLQEQWQMRRLFSVLIILATSSTSFEPRTWSRPATAQQYSISVGQLLLAVLSASMRVISGETPEYSRGHADAIMFAMSTCLLASRHLISQSDQLCAMLYVWHVGVFAVYFDIWSSVSWSMVLALQRVTRVMLTSRFMVYSSTRHRAGNACHNRGVFWLTETVAYYGLTILLPDGTDCILGREWGCSRGFWAWMISLLLTLIKIRPTNDRLKFL